MLTVKHCDNDGSEVLFEATQVRADRSPEQGAGCRVICDIEGSEQIIYQGREARNVEDRNNILWVMNRNGSTVATYYL